MNKFDKDFARESIEQFLPSLSKEDKEKVLMLMYNAFMEGKAAGALDMERIHDGLVSVPR